MSELLPHLARGRRRHHARPLDAHRRQQPRPVDPRPEHRPHRRPAARRWAAGSRYGLGRETQNLPAFVALTDPGQPAGAAASSNWSNGWLPSLYQGTVVRPREPRILNLDPPPHLQGAPQAALPATTSSDLNRDHLAAHPGELDLEARIASYELAARMQTRPRRRSTCRSETAADAEAVRPRRPGHGRVRHPLPDRPPAGRARRAVRAALHAEPVLGPPRQHPHAPAQRLPQGRPGRPRRW